MSKETQTPEIGSIWTDTKRCLTLKVVRMIHDGRSVNVEVSRDNGATWEQTGTHTYARWYWEESVTTGVLTSMQGKQEPEKGELWDIMRYVALNMYIAIVEDHKEDEAWALSYKVSEGAWVPQVPRMKKKLIDDLLREGRIEKVGSLVPKIGETYSMHRYVTRLGEADEEEVKYLTVDEVVNKGEETQIECTIRRTEGEVTQGFNRLSMEIWAREVLRGSMHQTNKG